MLAVRDTLLMPVSAGLAVLERADPAGDLSRREPRPDRAQLYARPAGAESGVVRPLSETRALRRRQAITSHCS